MNSLNFINFMKTPSPDIVTLRIRTSIYEFEGDIKSITDYLSNPFRIIEAQR